MIRAVLDTNVLVSGFASVAQTTSTPAELIRRWRFRRYSLIVSEPILYELEHTLRNEYFQQRLTPRDVDDALKLLGSEAIHIHLGLTVARVASHPEDDLILATAVSGDVDYLVTGDRALQALGSYQGVQIVSPRHFLGVLDGQ